jgi:hypothetical protein
MKITSPAEGYTGKDRYGETVLDFQDGVAEHEGDLPDGIRQYLQGAGYGIGSSKPTQPEPVVGGPRRPPPPLDPKPEDFLAPINAGEANPHGPKVVSPEIHASGPAGIRPGDVFVDDTDKQEVREKAFAEARLIDGATAAEANRAEVPDIDDFGPLGLSDPGSVEQGVEGAKEVAKAEKAEASAEVVDDEPAPAKKAPAKKTAAKKSAAKKS